MSSISPIENNVPNKVMGKQPGRNGGMLNAGGTPGNKGGTGRPPSEVKAAWMDALRGKGTARLRACIESADDATALRAIEVAARHTLGTRVELANPEEVIGTLATVLASHAGEPMSLALAKQIASEVKALLGMDA